MDRNDCKLHAWFRLPIRIARARTLAEPRSLRSRHRCRSLPARRTARMNQRPGLVCRRCDSRCPLCTNLMSPRLWIRTDCAGELGGLWVFVGVTDEPCVPAVLTGPLQDDA